MGVVIWDAIAGPLRLQKGGIGFFGGLRVSPLGHTTADKKLAIPGFRSLLLAGANSRWPGTR